MQNPNGGFASYELVRAPQWLEYLNPAEVFGEQLPFLPAAAHTAAHSDAGNIMTEYCYPECTTSVITALAIFRKHFPDYRTADIEYALSLFLFTSVRADCWSHPLPSPPSPLFVLFSGAQSKALCATCTTHKLRGEAGSVRGASASRTRRNSRSRVCPSSAKRTRRVRLRAAGASSYSVTSARTVAGARVTRCVHSR